MASQHCLCILNKTKRMKSQRLWQQQTQKSKMNNLFVQVNEIEVGWAEMNLCDCVCVFVSACGKWIKFMTCCVCTVCGMTTAKAKMCEFVFWLPLFILRRENINCAFTIFFFMLFLSLNCVLTANPSYLAIFFPFLEFFSVLFSAIWESDRWKE